MLNTTLFHDDERIFYEKLEKHTAPLRHCAQDMIDFIDHLEHQTKAIQILKDEYLKLQRIPIKNLVDILEDIKADLVNVEFQFNESQEDTDFLGFYEIQNHFNAEITCLVHKAIEIQKLLR